MGILYLREMEKEEELIPVIFEKWRKVQWVGKIICWFKKKLGKITFRQSEKDYIGIIAKKEKMNKFDLKRMEIQLKKKQISLGFKKIISSKWIEKQGLNIEQGTMEQKRLLFYTIPVLLQALSELQKRTIQEQEVHILVNDYKTQYINLCEELARKVKIINIVTKNRTKFLKFENETLEQGNLITIRNNKQKSLKNASIIINLDFTEEQIKEYQINRNAIFIQIKQFTNLENKLTDGIIIRDIRIKVKEEWKEKMRKYGKDRSF